MRVVAVIGGTGLNQFPNANAVETIELSTPYGTPSGQIQKMAHKDTTFYFLARHGQPHSLPPHQINYRANIHALHQLGVTDIFAVNAVGGITENAPTGQLCIPDQLIDYTWGREHTFSQQDNSNDLLSIQHIDFSQPFTESLRELLLDQGHHLNLPMTDGGTYAVTQGPRLETAAEITKYERDGCDIVGMTAMPEAALARELDIRYASICLSVNPAAGKSEVEITMDDIRAVINKGINQVTELLDATLEAIATQDSEAAQEREGAQAQ
ncbi:S-methyl-5'-thioinosine phosphorylase [Litoribrevibacter albus]|uniref:Probable S-methyl-5'-thioinosine phosphorylase n=1 Tax=Litoribrevibacter albus TaxID=1473156 RepID=A0AA37W4V1_9GAMM|nr:S-methyl-5'-thioinosine phosphorylase [Litoribrevibacter albus]GLQ30507.1 putative S-methyl-5'-thioinosine phosphorylase [Litoribrevibacter albus]